ncbi:MAG TPA: TonB-dependent receptor [Candidatus Elarobacter sp.]
MSKSLARSALAVVALVVMLLQGTIGVLAGTTGSINGTVTEAQSNTPLAGAHVTVSSPSQQSATNTDAQGRFSFLSLAPDTYTLTVTAPGHQTVTSAGVTVQADNNINLSFSAPKQLTRIGGTTARANTDLVKPGTVADVYSVNAAQAAAAAGLGGGGSLSQAYSAIASVPGVFVPQGQQGWGQAVYVRGGNYTQLGYEYDGVPVQRAYDAYPSSTLSALGQQEVQVYTGSQPGTAQSSGLAGFVNQVIKTGTYPGTATASLSAGGPIFYHKGQLEFGGASPDRNFSYYIATAGYNQASRVLDQFNGGGTFGSGMRFSGIPFAQIAQNCDTPQATGGCYANGFGAGPNGYLWLPLAYGQNQYLQDRESVLNLHVGVPHKKDGLKDDIQALADVSYLNFYANDAWADLGPEAQQYQRTGAVTINGVTIPACASGFGVGSGTTTGSAPCIATSGGITPMGPTWRTLGFVGPLGPNGYVYPFRSLYNGPVGTALTPANLTQLTPYLYPGQPNSLTTTGPGRAQAIDPQARGTERINDAIFKLQYTHAMGPNAYARIYGYSLYSDWLNNDPNGYGDPFASFIPNDYILPTHTRGIGLALADQVGPHLLSLTGGYSLAVLSRWNNGFPSTANPVAVLVDSTNPTAGCYTSTLTLADCNNAGGPTPARYTIPATNAAPTGLVARNNGTITAANASTFTCGTGPCEYLTVGSGLNGSFNNVTPRFANLTVSDTWNVTPKLTVDAALRYDSFRYDITSGNTAIGPNPQAQSPIARTLFTNSYNMFHCNLGVGNIQPTATANSCPAGTQLAFNNNGVSQFWYGGFQPRLGATFQVNPLNVLRAGYGRYLQPTSSAYLYYNRAGADVAGYDAPKFYAYGFNTPTHDIPPQESWNFDFSWEHQVRGTDVSWKLTPFVRHTRNENINVVLDPTTAFVSGIDTLSSNISGIEMLFRKGDFSRNGFAAQLAYTYTHEMSRFQKLPGGLTALDGVNSAVKGYNAYTSFCAAHPTDGRCGSTTTGGTASPCYAVDGTPDPACTAGSVANPYWNAPAQPLFDVNGSYYPYNQTLGTGFSANASSYNIPHVATLILNYKHDKWAFTPTVQLTGGGRYGSPVQGIGIDPAAGGCTPLPGGSTAGDPRYPYGAPGGAPYMAQDCVSQIVIPDPYTQKFDNLGSFVEPTQVVANLGITYQASKKVTLNLLAVNVFGTCFGGTQMPWTNAGSKNGCWYGAATGFQAGNFYNPGNPLQAQSYPYFPVTGGIAGQTVYGTGIQPLQIFFSAQLKL